MSIEEAVIHLINSSDFNLYAACNPPEGTMYRQFKLKFLKGITSKEDCIGMLEHFGYVISNSNVQCPPKGNIKIYRIS